MSSHQNWQSFWDLASPERGAEQLRLLYGAKAAEAAAGCAAAARADNRNEDYRFWTAVLIKLQAFEMAPRVEPSKTIAS